MSAIIGDGFCIRHTGSIVIGGRTEIGKNCEIRQDVTFGGNIGKMEGQQSQPKVGNYVLVGAGAKILGPIEVGDNVIIGANAVVVKDIPENSVVGGVPARELHSDLNEERIIIEQEIFFLKNRISKIEKILSQSKKN